jgi:CRP-like cAMP-binding protein
MKKYFKNIILCQPLFNGCDKKAVEFLLLNTGELLSFRSGEEMKPCFSPAVGILLSGRGIICSGNKDKSTILKFISPESMIGVASVFSAEPPNTRTFACGDGKSEMFFIRKEAFEALLDTEPAFRRNLVSFLADRITFLNSKIDFVTAGSAERRLALFIKSSPKSENGSIYAGMSMTSLARALDLSRASLYRAFESLEQCGAIRKDGKAIEIISPEELDKIC